MNVLVTGAAGLVGSEVVNNLTSFKHNVVAIDSLLYESEYLKPVPFHRGNVGDVKFMREIFVQYKFDAVFHLAGIVGDPACAARPLEAREANITSLEILRDNYKGRILFPSSCSVYGVNEDIVTESSPLNPVSLYAEMKREGEQILKDTNAIIFRFATLHGVTDRLRADLVVNSFAIRAVTEGKIPVFGGHQYRPLIHVKDVVKAMIPHMATNVQGIYNLVEKNYTILEIANIIAAKTGAIVETSPMPSEDKRNYMASAALAKDVWGFNPTYSIEDTVDSIIALHKAGRIKNYNHSKYSNILSLEF